MLTGILTRDSFSIFLRWMHARHRSPFPCHRGKLLVTTGCPRQVIATICRSMSRETRNARNNVTFLPVRLFLHPPLSSDRRITGHGRNVNGVHHANPRCTSLCFTNDDDASMSMAAAVALILRSVSNGGYEAGIANDYPPPRLRKGLVWLVLVLLLG